MQSSSNNKEGYKNTSGTQLSYEGLASADFDIIPISIDPSARDVGNPDASTTLRPYLAMGYDTSTGRYKEFNPLVHEDATVVVLAEEVRNLDTVSGNTTAVAFYRAIFKSDIVIEPSAVTWTEVQRISIRDNV